MFLPPTFLWKALLGSVMTLAGISYSYCTSDLGPDLLARLLAVYLFGFFVIISFCSITKSYLFLNGFDGLTD